MGSIRLSPRAKLSYLGSACSGRWLRESEQFSAIETYWHNSRGPRAFTRSPPTCRRIPGTVEGRGAGQLPVQRVILQHPELRRNEQCCAGSTTRDVSTDTCDGDTPASNSYSSTKVTFMMTWYSTTTRLPSTRTSCSFIHALRTFRSVAVALWMPCWIASSKLFSDVALISVILAADTSLSFRDRLSGYRHSFERGVRNQSASCSLGRLSPPVS